jgi:hypothetical protein
MTTFKEILICTGLAPLPAFFKEFWWKKRV